MLFLFASQILTIRRKGTWTPKPRCDLEYAASTHHINPGLFFERPSSALISISRFMSSITMTLSSHDWRRTKFYHSCGDVLYWVDTVIQQTMSTPPTRIYKRKAEDNGWDLVASLEFPRFSPNRIIYNKEMLYLDAMFPSKGFLNP